MKTQSATQAKQLVYMKPMLCHWAGDKDQNVSQASTVAISEAGRRRAAPHIKTYVRFKTPTMTGIDWAMVTSANLSTQAWGSAVSASGEVRICSYEIGVLIWPGLFADKEESHAEMVPVFQRDKPPLNMPSQDASNPPGPRKQKSTVVGFRLPYDLPLVPYDQHDSPWCATAPCSEPDWMGRTWPGF